MNLAARAILPPGEAEASPEGLRQYLAFVLAGRAYAVPLAEVAEISPNRTLSRMPHMPKGVEGLLDLRGAMVPVLNLRTRLGLPPIEGKDCENILVVQLAHGQLGLLVDRVESVLGAPAGAHVPSSPLLAGKEGSLVTGFLRLGERVVVLLDLEAVAVHGTARTPAARSADLDLEQRLDEGLRALIALAPGKEEAERSRIIPQMETAIAHTEEEVAKVVERVEDMLAAADASFQGLARIKQELRLGRLPGHEALVAEMDRAAQEIQDQIFELLQQLQFQDIARQKLERVLNHLRGLQAVMGQKFRDLAKGH